MEASLGKAEEVHEPEPPTDDRTNPNPQVNKKLSLHGFRTLSQYMMRDKLMGQLANIFKEYLTSSQRKKGEAGMGIHATRIADNLMSLLPSTWRDMM